MDAARERNMVSSPGWSHVFNGEQKANPLVIDVEIVYSHIVGVCLSDSDMRILFTVVID